MWLACCLARIVVVYMLYQRRGGVFFRRRVSLLWTFSSTSHILVHDHDTLSLLEQRRSFCTRVQAALTRCRYFSSASAHIARQDHAHMPNIS